MVTKQIVSIPTSLLESGDYQSLSLVQQRSLVSRLRHCAEIAENGRNATEGDVGSLLEVIDDIELDALSIMSSFFDAENTVSPYRVHSSWTFECDRRLMAKYIGEEESNLLRECPLPFDAALVDMRGWLSRWGNALQLALGRFSKSSSFSESVAQLIVVDALVSSYLVFAATARLNPQLI